MSDFQEIIDQINKYMVELIKLNQKIVPKHIIVNKNYLNKLLNSRNVVEFSFNSSGDMWIDYDTGYLGTFTGIPLIIDDKIDTFAFVYEDGRIVVGK